MDKPDILKLIAKPEVMPKNILHPQSYKQAINYYHKIMVKRLEIK